MFVKKNILNFTANSMLIIKFRNNALFRQSLLILYRKRRQCGLGKLMLCAATSAQVAGKLVLL
jgi:hypothetical protein